MGTNRANAIILRTIKPFLDDVFSTQTRPFRYATEALMCTTVSTGGFRTSASLRAKYSVFEAQRRCVSCCLSLRVKSDLRGGCLERRLLLGGETA